ncbi:MAG: tRNA (adenosine(37)-N6)-dimethylallyltransferase MiaA [Oscillibacter sp.]|nr:tRNA (adenosine(37)-N6)-dimethylallyltransferase MiaA [Oscillibacter sp.]
MPPKILAVVGPTASGKTKMAVELALRHNGEVVSADSMHIYRTLDIGTAKPTVEEMQGVPHHMLDVAEPEEDFSVARYVEMAAACVDDILARGKLPILAGGTGLYIDSLLSGRTFASFAPESPLRAQLQQRAQSEGSAALWQELQGIDPEAAARLHPNDEKRIIRALEVWYQTGKTITQHNLETQAIPPRYEALTIGLAFENREDMWNRIDRRVDEMMAAGLVDEVRGVLERGVPKTCTAMQAIGYKEMVQAVMTGGDVLAAAEEVKLRSRQYAKRQLTWFRRNVATRWYKWGSQPDFHAALRTSTEYMEEFGLV